MKTIKIKKEDYLELLEWVDGMSFDTVDPKNYTLDKVYDKEWFLNDLNRIFSFYNYHQSDRTLEKDLDLWCAFLHGCLSGRFV